MDWILDNIWVLIAIASVIARVLMKKKDGDAEAGGQSPPAKEYEFEDPELAERTRKIREEIQRKIAERRGEHNRPPVLSPAPAAPAPMARSPEATPPPLTLPQVLREVLQPGPEPVAPARRMPTVNVAEESERQAALMERFKEAKLMKAAAQRRMAFEASTADKEPAALQQARSGVLDDLRDPQALRRAFILREVIGPPLALR